MTSELRLFLKYEDDHYSFKGPDYPIG